MLSKFASCNSQVKTRLFRIFCTNYHGCVLWRINSNVGFFEYFALIIMAVFYGGLIQMLHRHSILLGEIV